MSDIMSSEEHQVNVGIVSNGTSTISPEDLVRKFKIRKAMKSVPLTPFDQAGITTGLETKKFARCKCSYLDEMYDDITAKDSHYVTCMDSLLRDEKMSREEFNGMHVSTIVKGYYGSYDIDEPTLITKLEDSFSELIGSRLANLFGVKTQYVAEVKNNPYCTIIVDFLKDKETIQDFKEFTDASPSSYLSGFNISSWINPLVNKIFFMTPDALFNPELAKADINRVVGDFAKQYLFKKYIIHDSDLCSVNIGFVVAPDGKYDVAPAFDFSNCFAPGVRTPQGEGLEADIEYLSKNYPDILKCITHDFEVAYNKKDEIRSIVKKFISDRNLIADDFCNLVENSALNFVETSKMYLSGKYLDREM